MIYRFIASNFQDGGHGAFHADRCCPAHMQQRPPIPYARYIHVLVNVLLLWTGHPPAETVTHTHPRTNRARRRLTSLIKTNASPLRQTRTSLAPLTSCLDNIVLLYHYTTIVCLFLPSDLLLLDVTPVLLLVHAFGTIYLHLLAIAAYI